MVIKDMAFKKKANNFKPNRKKRVVLRGIVRAYDAWLFNNPKALTSVKRGLADAEVVPKIWTGG